MHEVNLRSAVPQAWAEGELATPTHVASTYARKSVQLKIFRIAGGVSHFAQSSTAQWIDLMESEVQAAVESLADLLEFMVVWGDADADAYQTSGLDNIVAGDSASTVVDVDGTVTLATLDNMIDSVENYRGVNRDPKVFLASNQMISKISGLETRIGMDLRPVDYPGGLRMATYRNIPLLPASYVRPASTTSSPALSGSAVAGGSLTAGTYRYKIASVTMSGEQIASAGVSVTTATTNLTARLTWTADADAKLYKIYRTGDGEADDDDNYDLIKVIAAKTYDSAGTVTGTVATFDDDGTYTAKTRFHPLAANEETIWLVDLNPIRGLSWVYLPNRAGTGVDGDGFVRFMPLARTKSSEDYLIEVFSAVQVPQPQVMAVARRVSPV